MIQNDQELAAAQERIARFQKQVLRLREKETDAASYALSISGYLSEVDKMQLEVREYLSLLPLHSSLAA